MAQSLSKIYVHLVFSTKGRTNTIPKDHLSEVHAYIAGILKNINCNVIGIGGTANHIHILFCLPNTITLSNVVRIVKSNSSKWINQNNSKYIRFSWQDGYGAFSISQNHVEAVKSYISTQEEHHKKVSFQDEFRRLCSLFQITINERFVWL